MKTPWVISGTLGPAAGELLEPLIPLVDAVPITSDSQTIKTAVAQLFIAPGVPAIFGAALQAINDKEINRWFSSLDDIQGFADDNHRILGWPDEDFKWEPGQSATKDKLKIVLSGSGGAYLVVDPKDDTREGDTIVGASAQLRLFGQIGLQLRNTVKISAPVDATLGFGFNASGSESVTYGIAISNPNLSGASVAARGMASLVAKPSDYKGMLRQLSAEFDGISFESVVLNRQRDLGVNASLSVPISIKAGTVTISGSGKLTSTKSSMLDIQRDGDDLVVKLKGSKVNGREYGLGLGVALGLSSFSALSITKLVEHLGKISEGIAAADKLLDIDSDRDTLLKPGSYLRDRLESGLKDRLGGDSVLEIVAKQLDVKKSQVVDVLTSELVDFLDDQLDVFSLGKLPALRDALKARLAGSAIDPIVKATDKALDDALDHLQEKLDSIPANALARMLETAGIDATGTASDVTQLRRYLNTARERVDELIKSFGDKAELGVSVEFSYAHQSSMEDSAIATLRFADTSASRSTFSDVVKQPVATAQALLLENLPEGVAVQSILRSRHDKRSSTTGWKFNLLSLSVGQTVTRWEELNFKQSLTGTEIVGKAGAQAEKSSGKKSRRIEIANVFTGATDGTADGSFKAAKAKNDGLKILLTNNEPKDLDHVETEQFLAGLVAADAVRSAQAEDVCAWIRSTRKDLAYDKKMGGTVEVSLEFGEEGTDALYKWVQDNVSSTRRLAATSLVHNDANLKNILNILENENDVWGEDVDEIRALLHLTDAQALKFEKRFDRGEKNQKDDARDMAVAIGARDMMDTMASTLRKGGTMLGRPFDEADVRELNKEFKRLDNWLDPKRPFMSIDRVSSRTRSLFETMVQLGVQASGAKPTVIVSVKLGAWPKKRFI